MSNAMHRERKRIPPYGQPILEARYKGLAPRDICVCLDDWKAFAGRIRIVLPPDLDPAACDFCFVAGCDCIVAWNPRVTSAERRDAVAAALVRNLARRIWILNRAAPHQSFFVKSVLRGLEHPEIMRRVEEGRAA
ncbi:MAG: hypothetical protein HS110_07345 [Zoogloeaceae bacterium]|nr:hypothetical protein [Zoogloeaceae bacterium]